MQKLCIPDPSKGWGGIYVIHNLANHKFYVGSTVNFDKRFSLHRHNLRNNKHHSVHLQSAWNIYGEKAFAFLRLQVIEAKDERLRMEQSFIDSLNPAYNMSKSAISCEGVKRSPETRRKMSIAVNRPERIAKLRERASKPKTEEHKAKIAAAHRGMKASEATKAKLRAAWQKRRMSK